MVYKIEKKCKKIRKKYENYGKKFCIKKPKI